MADIASDAGQVMLASLTLPVFTGTVDVILAIAGAAVAILLWMTSLYLVPPTS